MSGWISIKDKVPTEGVYLFNTKRNGVQQGYISAYASRYKKPEAYCIDKGCQFTHWMPLPEPPKD